jgi:hypothetical protein
MTDSELEQRLRGALTARADQITQARLHPAVPPTASVRPSLAHRIRWWMPALAAALVTAVVLVRLPGPDPVAPTAPPASAPATSTTVPAPVPAPSSPAAAHPVPTTQRQTVAPSANRRTASAPHPLPGSRSATDRPGSAPSATSANAPSPTLR